MAEFPDSVTTRGTRHLYELANQVVKGDRAMMVYLVQRMDCDQFRIAEDIDPAYQKAFSHAVAVGVEVLCLDVCITTERIRVRRPIEVLQN
jgi:sugar fermentation stimulation protein A